jgi:SNF2 family DNA or RNA helicase
MFSTLFGTKEQGIKPVGPDLPYGYIPPTKPKAHQIEAIHKMCDAQYMGLFDEMGLGKTLSLLYTSLCLIKGRQADCAVVICKASHEAVWREQIAEHDPRARIFSVIGKPPAFRKEPWPLKNTDIYFINYELISRMWKASKSKRKEASMVGFDFTNLANLLANRRCIAVLDESHCIQNHKANVTKALVGLSDAFSRRYIATGSPITERPENLWSQFYFLDHGKTLGENYWNFVSKYANFYEDGRGHRWITGYKNLDRLRKRIQKSSIRRTKDQCLDLPDKIYTKPILTPKTKQAKLIEKISTSMIDALHDMGGPYADMSEGKFSKYLQQLIRASAIPSTVDPLIKESAKIDELIGILDECLEDQAVVWCVHKDVVEATAKALEGKGISCTFIHGDTDKKRERPARKAAFKSGEKRVLVATMASLREAETFVNARIGYWMELGFERINWVQSQDRHHRIGATQKVLLCTPIVKGSLDHFIRNMSLEEKDFNARVSVDRSQSTGVDRTGLLNYLEQQQKDRRR